MDEKTLLDLLGGRLRELRNEAGFSLMDLAERSGLSRRHLTEAEAGRANLSFLKLAKVAEALKCPLGVLCDVPLPRGNNRRIALVGVRGAGKSTVGRAMALKMEIPFVELDRVITEVGGLGLPEIFSLHGEEHYRRLEREGLERTLQRHGSMVLATGGSIVTHEETWNRLRESCQVVWLKADAEDHWNRVVNQGDTRPMGSNPRAMEELRELLREREPLYSRCHFTVDTSRVSPSQAVDRILETSV